MNANQAGPAPEQHIKLPHTPSPLPSTPTLHLHQGSLSAGAQRPDLPQELPTILCARPQQVDDILVLPDHLHHLHL